jgi:DNA-directed RNA polymerase specialized sigma24 family protein
MTRLAKSRQYLMQTNRLYLEQSVRARQQALQPWIKRANEEIYHQLALWRSFGTELDRRFAIVNQDFSVALEQYIDQHDHRVEALFPLQPDSSGSGHASVIRDLLTLCRKDTTEQARTAAARRLATRLPPFLADPAARRALRRIAQEQRIQSTVLLREQLFPVGLLLAATQVSTSRRIRLGAQWLKQASGRVAAIPPVELLPAQFAYWFFQEARNAVEAHLLDQAYPSSSQDLLEEASVKKVLAAWERAETQGITAARRDSAAEPVRVSADKGVSELYTRYGRDRSLFPTPEAQLEAKSLIRALAIALSPQEQAILRLLEEEASPGEIRAEMGISEGNYRQLLHRLRNKASRLLKGI